MEGGRRGAVESDYDDIHMILQEEIPTATSGGGSSNPRIMRHAERIMMMHHGIAAAANGNGNGISPAASRAFSGSGGGADCFRSPLPPRRFANPLNDQNLQHHNPREQDRRLVVGNGGGEHGANDGMSLVSAFQELEIYNNSLSEGKESALLSPRRNGGRFSNTNMSMINHRQSDIKKSMSELDCIASLPDVFDPSSMAAVEMGSNNINGTRRENGGGSGGERKAFDHLDPYNFLGPMASLVLDPAAELRRSRIPTPFYTGHHQVLVQQPQPSNNGGMPPQAFQLPQDLSAHYTIAHQIQQQYLQPPTPQYCINQQTPQMATTWVASEDPLLGLHQAQAQQALHELKLSQFQALNAYLGYQVKQQQLYEKPPQISKQIERSARGLYYYDDRPVNSSSSSKKGAESGRNGHCKYFSSGICWKGDSCTFAHVKYGQIVANGGGPVYSSTNSSSKVGGQQPLNCRVGKNLFPEKMLTRSHGLNSLRAPKSSSLLDIDDVLHHNYSNGGGGALQTNGYLRQHHQHHPASVQDNDLVDPSARYLHVRSFDFNSLDECTGRIYEMAKDHQGCRLLQDVLIDSTPEDVEKIFVEIIPYISELMIDPFANYLVQKLLEKCNEEQRTTIVRTITSERNELLQIACDVHGTRVVQKIIETLQTTEHFARVVKALKPGCLRLMKDPNGNHVAQRCLQHFPPEFNSFLYEVAIGHCVELSTDRQGCCVMQKCLSHSDYEAKQHLLSEIISNALVLSLDQYGNYVVQFALGMNISWATGAILDQLYGNFYDLSTQRYSSHVAEKCLTSATEDQLARIIREMIRHPKFFDILQDSNGNYVVQKALETCKGKLHVELVEAIQPHIPMLKSNHHGKNVLTKVGLRK